MFNTINVFNTIFHVSHNQIMGYHVEHSLFFRVQFDILPLLYWIIVTLVFSPSCKSYNRFPEVGGNVCNEHSFLVYPIVDCSWPLSVGIVEYYPILIVFPLILWLLKLFSVLWLFGSNLLIVEILELRKIWYSSVNSLLRYLIPSGNP